MTESAINPARRIPVCVPYLNGREEEYIQDAVHSTWISSRGKYLDRFEKEFPAYVGVKYGTATCNGTLALHLAAKALNLKAGDEVILPSFTMIASTFALCYCGVVPVFLDCDPEDWNMDVNQVEAAISPKTRAIMVVHIYGHPTNMGPVMEIARRHNLQVIEDAAEAHGSEYLGQKCGSFGDVNCFSFFANKNMTCGEGGMVVTDSPELFDRLRYLKNLCFPLGDARRYDHEEIGFNYRMSNLHAALGCAQLECIDEYVDLRRKNAHAYNERLGTIPGLQLPVERSWAKNTYWMYGVVCNQDFGFTRDELAIKLAAAGIETRAFFKPMHQQKALIDYGFRAPFPLPHSEALGSQGLYLPSSSSLSESEMDYVCDTIRRLQGSHVITRSSSYQ
ncbi:MAG: DegT/DnrJ/EryC1/StrS family aminotransferase [Formivibrio sp.]|nr:DegT/DnrJ/EryC1/StrS family aminotransferase [Formivibrio sp.]